MNDDQILDLYWARSEEAVARTAERYGTYCRTIARNILDSQEDEEECVNDAYLRAWNAIPPERPENLGAFLGRITRNLALDRYRRAAAEKRSADRSALVLEELKDCIPAGTEAARLDDGLALREALGAFFASLSPRIRVIFLRRYWYFFSTKEIAAAYGMSEGSVKMTLLRTRRKLKQYLEKEGISL